MRDILTGRVVGFTLAALFAAVCPALTQGVQTGTISGVIQSADGAPLPGVTVVTASPEQQGDRTAVSDSSGVYYLRGLLPGSYRVSFELSGFRPSSSEDVRVSTGSITLVNATLPLASVTESVTVTAPTPSAVASSRTSQTYTKAVVDSLPVGRRPVDIAELAPNVTTSAFNPAQLVLGGSFGFDNVFMVNGVDVNDNVNGTSNNLFIEDAIQETTVLSHGISAEWGRFSGGVINVVTRSGGNTFSGSFREGLSNPKWIGQTPLERVGNIKHADVLGKTHEGTFGGPILRDRVWFFTAGRAETVSTPNTFAQNGAGYTRTDRNRRGELKITATPAAAQTVQASFVENATTQDNASAISAPLLDARMLTKRELPNRLFGTSYSGVIGSRTFATAQYSEKRQGFRNNGGTSTALTDSPFRTMGATTGVPAGLFYNAPYLDATDPEDRNNRQLTGSLSYALSDSRMGTGSHELKVGAEYFKSTGIGGNSQSSTGYVFFTDYLTANGAVVRDASGTPVPVFTPDVTQVWNFRASKGAKVDITTTSLFLQDRWVPSRRTTVEAGARIESVRGKATGGIVPVDTWSIVPRIGVAYDLEGNARTVLHGTYSHYSGKYSQVQFAVNTNVGRPSEVDYVYSGPAGSGRDFAPGFDLTNYTTVSFASFPTANVRVADDIQSPLTKEFTLGIARQLGRRGHARATYAWRKASQFVEDFTSLAGGVTNVDLVGPLTNRVFDNTGELHRDYQAVVLQSSYRLRDNVTVEAHYTGQLRNHGAFAGESANQPGLPSIYGNFPEIFGPALDRLLPEGRLDNYQQHKLRVFGTYLQDLGRYGSVNISPLWRVNSGAVYSLTASIPVPVQQLQRNPGYPTNDVNASSRETVFFGDRGGNDFKGYGVMDLAATYTAGRWAGLQPWFKVEVYNLFNNQKLIAWDKTVTANTAGTRDANGIPTTYVQGPRFGQATSGNHFPQPYLGQNGSRAARLAFGVRF